jgi:hypothetical protein
MKKIFILAAFLLITIFISSNAYSQASFSDKTDFTTGDNPNSVSFSDFNGDGKRDMAYVSTDENTVSVSLNTTITGASTPTFSPSVDFIPGSLPVSVSIGDFNGDGKPDMVVVNYFGNSVSVFMNTTVTGASTPTFSAKTDFATAHRPYAVSIGDFNLDGKPDLAVTNSSSNSVSVFLNTAVTGASTPAFSPKTDFTTGTVPYSVSIFDFNGDGKLDMAVANESEFTISVFINTTTPGASTPAFSAKTDFATGNNPYSVTAGDFNGDGKQDLAIANNLSNSVSILMNTTTTGASTPTFSHRVNFATENNPFSVSICDINRDGKPDLAVPNSVSNTVSVFLNKTVPGALTPTFTSAENFTTGINPTSVSEVDLNGDGKQDLATTNAASGSVSVLLNTMELGAPSSSFSHRTDFATPAGAYTSSAGDLNGDGKPDIVTANYTSSTVSVFLNTTAPGSTVPAFNPRADFIAAHNPRAVSISDINGDGKQDLAVSGTNLLSVFLNTTTPGATTPTFSAATTFPTGDAYSIVNADFNGDGKPDLALTDASSGQLAIFINTTTAGASTPTFSARTDFIVGNSPSSVAAGDFNGDGKPDLAVNSTPLNICVFLNTTTPGALTPTFAAKKEFDSGDMPVSVSIGDFNGDGKLDLAAANRFSYTISVFINITIPGSSEPLFVPKTDIVIGIPLYSVANSDLNGDGKPDLAVTTDDASGTSIVAVFLNNTIPGALIPIFTARKNYVTGTNPNTVLLSDFNGDGKKDLSTISLFQNSISVLLNSGLFTLPVENEGMTGIPSKFSLEQNYPNPFNPTTKINYQLANNGFVSIKIYNIIGKEIAQLVNGVQQAGYYAVNFNAAALPSGTYFYKLTTDKFSEVKKMVLVK